MFGVINSSSCFHVIGGTLPPCQSDIKILWLLELQEVKKTDLGNWEQMESTTNWYLLLVNEVRMHFWKMCVDQGHSVAGI